MLTFRYTCDKSACGSFVTAVAARKDSDLGRLYISPLEPLARTSLIGNLYENAIASDKPPA